MLNGQLYPPEEMLQQKIHATIISFAQDVIKRGEDTIHQDLYDLLYEYILDNYEAEDDGDYI